MRNNVAKLAYNGPGLERTLKLVIGDDEQQPAAGNRAENQSEGRSSSSDGPHSMGWMPMSLSVEEFSPSSIRPGSSHHEWGSAPGGENQTILHITPPGGGSIAMSKHIHLPGEWDSPIDPMNVIFHHHGGKWWVKQALNDGGWDEIICGSSKQLQILNIPHGGTNQWWEQHEHWDNKLGIGFGCPIGPRSHLREFHGDTGDTHTPGFRVYSHGPMHWEDSDHSADSIDPRRGQDDLFLDIVDGDHVGSWEGIWVSNSDSECDSCNNWDGLIDIYELLSDDHMWHSAPCTVDRYDFWTGSPGTMYVKFYCD